MNNLNPLKINKKKKRFLALFYEPSSKLEKDEATDSDAPQKREQISKHKPLAVQQKEKALAEQLKVINLDALILEEYIKQLDNQRFSLDLIKESLQAEIFGQLSKITEEEVWSKDYHNKLKTITNCPKCHPKPCNQYCNTHAGFQIWQRALVDQEAHLKQLIAKQSLLALLKLQSVATQLQEVDHKLASIKLSTD